MNKFPGSNSAVRIISKPATFGLALAAALASSATALADSSGISRIQHSAIECEGVSVEASTRINWTGGNAGVWCPLMTTAMQNLIGGFSGPVQVWVDVNKGWATTGSCNVVEMSGPASWWYKSADSVNTTASSNYDTVLFSNNLGGGLGSALGWEVECGLPAGAVLIDYQQRSYVTFDWTSW
jgi:hypothetical protein